MAHATIRDVARRANVSVASVSRALNGHDNVRPELREKVKVAARELGYVPHAGARSLSLARAHAIGVMLPDLHGEFFSEVVRGMDRAASARGLQLLLSNMHADPEQAVDAVRTMRGRVDGLVIMAPDIDTATLIEQLSPSLPAILINSRSDTPDRPRIRVDNEAGAEAMVDHLVDTGYRHIVHIAGAACNAEAADREQGYRRAMRRHDLEPRVIAGDFTEEGGAKAAEALLADRRGADAVFAANDMMAIGALVALRDAGIAVGREIGIAGFDDIPLARLISPGLTTMRVNIADIGASALNRIAAIVDGDDDTDSEFRHPELVVRASTSRRAEQ
ncbi:LacI family DNA-binding transcriptional regulator [Stakelama saccharophila]|uniref:LacI family DNA-binding transcriptional regulator n=1 Tax=Stakelama saccharophila TaxID=3075605 RepID=A0ABZ0BD49_9SPHN|nr:LacI family DNA-binding transcriptional regulator [Stakelama sp. W311]WNO54803.1 LacI family DNA-binding transcriptional regulator [Stakelama sp. W311]